jgi:hypothetical protein
MRNKRQRARLRLTQVLTSGCGSLAAAARVSVFLCLLTCLASPGAAQRKKTPEEVGPPAVDPYTEGKDAAMKKAGYESFGPLFWGDGHGSQDIEVTLDGIPILWVETAHFRIGSTLDEYTVADDAAEKKRVRAELTRLRKRIPKVKPKVRTLDPWLQLHLYAMRMEELYADVCKHFGVEDSDFPSKPPAAGKPAAMGQGPYLGQQEKFLVFLFQRKSSFSRYNQMYLGVDSEFTMRWNFHIAGSIYFGVAREFLSGSYGNDTAMFCALTNGLLHNFVDGFIRFDLPTPSWTSYGLAHWFSRKVDERFNAQGPGSEHRERRDDAHEWAPRVRGRVLNSIDPKLDDILAWSTYDDMKSTDHMMAWSRMDYLLQRKPKELLAFMQAMKAPLPGKRPDDPDELWVPRTTEALQSAFGLSLEEFDVAWRKYVNKNYPKP